MNLRIEELRTIISESFGWEGNLVFLPNRHYAKLLLLRHIFSKHSPQETNIFTVGVELPLETTPIGDWSQTKGTHFAVFSAGNMARGPEGYLFVQAAQMAPQEVEGADAFLFDLADGVTALGFRSDMELEPLVLGSNSASFADGQSFVPNGDFRRLECGTPNVPILMSLWDFYKNK